VPGRRARAARASDPLFRLLAQAEEIIDRAAEGVQVQGLREEVADGKPAENVGLDHVGVGGDEDDIPLVSAPPERGHELDSGHIGKPVIDDHEVDPGGLELGQGLVRVLGQGDAVLLAEDEGEGLADSLLIVDDGDLADGHGCKSFLFSSCQS